MKTTLECEISAAGTRRLIPTRAGTVLKHLAALLCAFTLGAGLTGCSFLKPVQSNDRHFVLTPITASGSASLPDKSLAVGLGQVKLPAYLFNTSLAVRKGTNEIDYLPSALWAERLDTGFQRVLAADLAIVLPTDHIQLSAWQKDDVVAEVYVTIEQFDVDTSGRGILVAQWRVLSPGGEKILKAGGSRLTHQGPAPDVAASAAVSTLSELVGDFSRELARALKETTPTSRDSAAKP